MNGLVWLRSDIRIDDNPALSLADSECDSIICVYLHAKKEWLDHNNANVKLDFILQNIADLSKNLDKFNIQLCSLELDSFEVIPEFIIKLCKENNINKCYWNNEFGGTYVSKYRVGTISGASITLGSATQWDTAWNSQFSSVYDSVNGKIVIAYRNGDNNTGEVIVGEITGSGSGASVTLGSPVSFSSVNTQSPNLAFDPNEGKVAITYRDDSTSVGVAKIGTVSGNSITVGAGTTFGTGDTYYPRVIYETNAKKFVYNYKISAGKEEWYYSVATVDGTTVSIGASVFVAHKTQTSGVVVFDPDEGTLVFGGNFALTSSGQTDDRAVAYKIEYLNTTLTSENFIGFSDAAYTNGQTAKIQIVSSVDDAQTGLTTGSQFYVQKDGSLGTTADTPSVFAGTALSGTEISIKN